MVQVISRTLAMLAAISEPPQGRSLTDVSQALDLPMPTAHRLLKVLVAEGFVRREPSTQLYHPGRALLSIAANTIGTTSLVDVVQPHLRDLAAEFDDTVFVAQIVNDRAVCVASQTSTRTLHVSVAVGRDLPLHASAAARVLLAYRDETETRTLLEDHDFELFTEETPRTVTEVLQHLEEIRSRGYDVCENELDADVWAVAAPIGTTGDRTVASLTIAAPRARVRKAAQRKAMTAAVVDHAAAISDSLPPAGPVRRPSVVAS